MTTLERTMSTGIKKVWLEKIERALSLAPPGDRALSECLRQLRDDIASNEYAVGLARTFHTEDSNENKQGWVTALSEIHTNIGKYVQDVYSRRANLNKLDEIRGMVLKVLREIQHESYLVAIDLCWKKRNGGDQDERH